MKNSIFLLICVFCLFTTGCQVSPFSPRNKQKISDSKIDEVLNNQNGIMTEIGKLHQENTVKDSTIGNNNNGIEILQGDGALILVFAVIVIAMLLIYSAYEKQKKISNILAGEIRNRNDTELHHNLIKAIAYTDVEKDVYNLIYRPKK